MAVGEVTAGFTPRWNRVSAAVVGWSAVAGPPDDRSWYQVMGLSRGASQTEVRDAYKRLARTLHPDRYATGTPTEQAFAERRMREVNAAWAVLGNPEQRRRYDESLRPKGTAGTARPTAARPSAPTPKIKRVVWGDDEIDARYQDDDVVVLTRAQYFLLRRLPIIVALVVAAVLFIGSAYAGNREDIPPVGPTTTTTLDVCVGEEC